MANLRTRVGRGMSFDPDVRSNVCGVLATFGRA